jgi:branched-chain amino acid transport system substrate-binding protein
MIPGATDLPPTDALRRAGTPSLPRRALLRGAAAAGIAMTLGCSPREPLRVGFLGGTSGRYADLGVGARRGAELAVEEVNAGGGVDGRRLELISRDDEQDGARAVQLLEELAGLGVVFVVGPTTSGVARAIAPAATRRGLPLISPTAGTHELSGLADAFFRVLPDTRASALRQAEGLIARGHRRLVALADTRNAPFTRPWAQIVGERFTAAGGALVATIEFEAAPGLAFAEVAQRAVAARGDVVLIVASATDSSVLAQQIRRLDTAMPIAMSAWAGTEELPVQGGRAVEGVQVPQFFDRASTAPRYLEFVRRFREQFAAPPGYAAANGHDALTLGVTALRRGGREGVLAALREVRSHAGLQREITFDGFGDCASPVYLTEIRDGRYVQVSQ